MEEFVIDVQHIEELQTINDIPALDLLFEKAKRTIVRGGAVQLVRKERTGAVNRFDEFSTLPDLERYREQVYKYL